MQIGAHVSISGSLDIAIDNAVERECNAFQIFTRNPRSWFAKDLDPVEVKNLRKNYRKAKSIEWLHVHICHICQIFHPQMMMVIKNR